MYLRRTNMLRNKQETFRLLEQHLQRYADKIVLYLAVPSQEGLVADDESDLLDKAMLLATHILDNLDADYLTESRYVHKQAGIYISCDINDEFSLDIEFGHSDYGDPLFIVNIEAIVDWDDDCDDMDIHWTTITKHDSYEDGIWHNIIAEGDYE